VFVLVGFKKSVDHQIGMPGTPAQDPARKGKNHQSIKNEEHHKLVINLRMGMPLTTGKRPRLCSI
jgi:hypothetical protein